MEVEQLFAPVGNASAGTGTVAWVDTNDMSVISIHPEDCNSYLAPERDGAVSKRSAAEFVNYRFGRAGLLLYPNITVSN